jgi:histidine triad (HIT) family protein
MSRKTRRRIVDRPIERTATPIPNKVIYTGSMHEEETLFTKIVTGEVPSHKIYEDERTLAFLNIYPAVKGHTLVIPKAQVATVWALTDDDYVAVMRTAKKVAHRLKEVLEVERIGEKIIGVDVPHAHVHLIPFNNPAEYYARETTDEPNHVELAALAGTLYFTD